MTYLTVQEKSIIIYFLLFLKIDRPDTMYASHSIDHVWEIMPKLLGVDLTPEELELNLLVINERDKGELH